MEAITPLVNDIVSDSCNPDAPQESVGEGCRAWGMRELEENLEEIVGEMLVSRKAMKAKYVSGN